MYKKLIKRLGWPSKEMLNDYGQGRRSAILEMADYCDKKIKEIEHHSKSDNPQADATRSGVRRAYQSMKIKLKQKYLNLKEDKL